MKWILRKLNVYKPITKLMSHEKCLYPKFNIEYKVFQNMKRHPQFVQAFIDTTPTVTVKLVLFVYWPITFMLDGKFIFMIVLLFLYAQSHDCYQFLHCTLLLSITYHACHEMATNMFHHYANNVHPNNSWCCRLNMSKYRSVNLGTNNRFRLICVWYACIIMSILE